MKKLLVLTTRYPYPVIGGDRLRIYQICKLLSKQYKLTLLSLCESKAELNWPLPEDGVFDSIERIFMPRWRSWLNCIAALPSKEPLQVAYYRSAEFYKRASTLSSEHDATLVHLIRASDAVTNLTGLKFLEMTDAISLNYERIRKTGHAKNYWRSHVFSIESLRLRKYEEEVVDHFDHSFLVSDIDRQFLFQHQESRLNRVSVCSNGVDLSGLPFQFSESGKDIVFIGNMFSLQNLDAANFMASDVLPLIRAHRGDVSLRLIGRIREEDAMRLKQIDGVIVTGEVPDVAVEARNAGVGVCPLRLGAGVQNKVLEYMALGLPTVSTSMGLEGFSAKDGKELLIANDAVELSDAVLRLLDNRDEAKTIAEAARKYVELNHSWESQLAPLVGKINESLGRSNQVKFS
jgi:glycosyltransferase involved in cell wall biosynthesis